MENINSKENMDEEKLFSLINQNSTKIKTLEKKVEVMSSLLNRHTLVENDHLKHIRESNHNINNTLQILKDPVLKVKNGKETKKFQSEILSEVWEATFILRIFIKANHFLQEHKFFKKVIYFILVLALLGFLTVPLNSILQLINDHIFHIKI